MISSSCHWSHIELSWLIGHLILPMRPPLTTKPGSCLGMRSRLVLLSHVQSLRSPPRFSPTIRRRCLDHSCVATLLTTAVLWLVQKTLELLHIGYTLADGDIAPPAYFLQHMRTWDHIKLAESYLLLCGLWCVKLPFLGFFRRLGYHVKGQKALWWGLSHSRSLDFSFLYLYYCFRACVESIEEVSTLPHP